VIVGGSAIAMNTALELISTEENSATSMALMVNGIGAADFTRNAYLSILLCLSVSGEDSDDCPHVSACG
jgi:acyl-CoA hydrolase